MKKSKGIKGKADAEWSRRVRARDPVCRLCLARPTVNAHHVIDRRHKATRLDLENGVGLCYKCHVFVEALSKVDWGNPWGSTNRYAQCMIILIHEDRYNRLLLKSKKSVKFNDDFVKTAMENWDVTKQ